MDKSTKIWTYPLKYVVVVVVVMNTKTEVGKLITSGFSTFDPGDLAL